jgi:hypothetical protein
MPSGVLSKGLITEIRILFHKQLNEVVGFVQRRAKGSASWYSWFIPIGSFFVGRFGKHDVGRNLR